MAFFEVGFEIIYLIFVFLISILIFIKAYKKHDLSYMIFGIMAFLLGFGDAFHLIPRILESLDFTSGNLTYALGIGKLITSVP